MFVCRYAGLFVALGSFYVGSVLAQVSGTTMLENDARGESSMIVSTNKDWPSQFNWKDYSNARKLEEAVAHYFPLGSDFESAKSILLANGFNLKNITFSTFPEKVRGDGYLFEKEKRGLIPFFTADCSWKIAFKEENNKITYAYSSVDCRGI